MDRLTYEVGLYRTYVMIDAWHSKFDPRHFLSRVDIDQLIERNKINNDGVIAQLNKPCILCRGSEGPGLLLNDKTYLCKACLSEVSKISYPEKYEYYRRQFIADKEARRQARTAFVDGSKYRKISQYAVCITILSLFLIFISAVAVVFSLGCLGVYFLAIKKHENSLNEWDRAFPQPIEPTLKHFHDPTAELSGRDHIILKIFNNWPGYPPFWEYLRGVVLKRDLGRCQITGCPSRVELHIHHKTPISQGGEHVPANLISLCRFHHALEPDEGHERIWGKISTRYFTIVRAHKRRNTSTAGYHNVCAHVRRLELTDESDLRAIIEYYGLCCPKCERGITEIEIDKRRQLVSVTCLHCNSSWTGPRKLSEETGPRIAEVLSVTRNRGAWLPRWDMLETRSDTTFRLLKGRGSLAKSPAREKRAKTTCVPKCPKCGSPMRLITPRKGAAWKAFWGCSKYLSTGCNGSISIHDE